MFFHLSKFVWFVTNPGTLLLLALLLGMVLSWTRWRGAGRNIVTVGVALFAVQSFVPAGELLMAELENRFPRMTELPDRLDGVIVLGGVVSPGLSAARGEISIGGAMERLVAFAELAKAYPEARLIFTGGSGDPFDQENREATFVRPLLAMMGVDTDRVIFEENSRNTAENASLGKKLANPLPGETWVLVTSAFHMPRSVGCFRRVGWEVLAHPVDYNSWGGGFFFNFNPLGNLGSLNSALHEWVGLAAYRLTGRTDAFFPGPAP